MTPLHVLLLFLFSAVSLHAETTAQQAQAAWANRGQAGQTEKAIQGWRQALKENPAQAELWIPLTRALGRKVRHTENSAEKKIWSEEAREAGAQAIAKNPNNPEAWAYYAESVGQWANARKGLGSLKKVKQAMDALKKALDLNPHYAYAHMLLAEFYRQAPSVISVGDKKKALEHAHLAVLEGPAYAINHVVHARALLDNDRKADAIAELRVVLTLPAPADAIPETASDQETARALLRSLGARDSAPPVETSSVCTADQPAGSACGH